MPPTLGLQGSFVEEFLETGGSLKVTALPSCCLVVATVDSVAIVLCLCLTFTAKGIFHSPGPGLPLFLCVGYAFPGLTSQ